MTHNDIRAKVPTGYRAVDIELHDGLVVLVCKRRDLLVDFGKLIDELMRR